MNHVFISYSSRDRAYAERIREMIKNDGLDTWIAPDNIPAGSTYTATISNAIKSAGAVVLILSANSLDSTWVEKEIERAVHYKKRIFPVQTDQTPLTDSIEFMISSTQIVSYNSLITNRNDANTFLEAVRKAVYGIVDQPVVPPAPKPAPKSAPKPVPKAEPKPAPKAEPKPAPKAEPKPAPKAEPKPAPKAEPKPVVSQPAQSGEPDQKKSGCGSVLIVIVVIAVVVSCISSLIEESLEKETTTFAAITLANSDYESKTPYVNDYIIRFPLSYDDAKSYFGIDSYVDSGIDGDYHYFTYNTSFGYPMIFLIEGTPPKDQSDFQFDGLFVVNSNAKICGVSPNMKLYEVRSELGYQYTERTVSNGNKCLEYQFKMITTTFRVHVFYDDSDTVTGIYLLK